MTRSSPPQIIKHLLGGIPMRAPSLSEEAFFRDNPDVAGMATEDRMVILNPFTKLNEQQMSAVALNEAARVFMACDSSFQPNFSITPEQEVAFAGYGPPDAVRSTIAARILSGDTSALAPTDEQLAFVFMLRTAMGAVSDKNNQT